MSTINAKQFNETIPTSLRPYINVSSVPLPAKHKELLEAFKIAIKCIENKIRVTSPLEVVIAKAPFKIQLGIGALCYTPKSSNIINVCINNMLVLLDAEKMFRYKIEIKTACILEEFVHALMNIKDEQLVSILLRCFIIK